MKGIILAGGKGERCQPLTSQFENKHLIPINDKLMVEYPLEILKSFGITEILLITSPEACGRFVELFKDGSDYGVNMMFKVQKNPDGVLGALKLAKHFIGKSKKFMVILGDNTFSFDITIKERKELLKNSSFKLFIKYLKGNAKDYGVLQKFGIMEKPNVENGNVVTGLYLYPGTIFEIIDEFNKSKRDEYEITDLNNYLLSRWYNDKGNENFYHMKENEQFIDMGSYEKIIKLTYSKLLNLEPMPADSIEGVITTLK